MKKNILLISNLYPNRDEPNRGVFIKQLTDEISKNNHITVISPIPWKPKIYYKFKGIKALPKEDIISGIQVVYTRHIVIPKIMRFTYAWLMYLALKPIVKKLNRDKKIDLISAHWVYPDGTASVKVARDLNIPCTLHALGCDINDYTKYLLRRIQITKALKFASRVVVKSSDLKRVIEELGVNPKKIETILNGVDRNKFYKRNIQGCRKELGLELNKKYLLFVGNIQVEKGLEYLIKALPSVHCDYHLLVVGGGPLSNQMEELAKTLEVTDKISFIGQVSHQKIPIYLNAADALCLPSLREGCPNIVLESLSCGTPVLASSVGAVPEILTRSEFGIIVEPRDSDTIASEIKNILSIKENYEINFDWYSWEGNAEKINNIFSELLNSNDT